MFKDSDSAQVVLKKRAFRNWDNKDQNNKSERPVDALAVKNVNYSLSDNLKSRDASASKNLENEASYTLSVYVCVCVCESLWVFFSICVHTACACVCLFVSVFASMPVCACVCMSVCACTWLCMGRLEPGNHWELNWRQSGRGLRGGAAMREVGPGWQGKSRGRRGQQSTPSSAHFSSSCPQSTCPPCSAPQCAFKTTKSRDGTFYAHCTLRGAVWGCTRAQGK